MPRDLCVYRSGRVGRTRHADSVSMVRTHQLIAEGPIAARIRKIQTALAATDQHVRLVMLPRSVHGEGERHGFIPRLIAHARSKGVPAT